MIINFWIDAEIDSLCFRVLWRSYSYFMILRDSTGKGKCRLKL